ncbi:hypothetical protein VNO77_42093 [Canavalia gladiata]|uniref:Uncharacterized protein n=1 Tax=Canavalia gladiata TaxID=3824 RepID=A0AAN9K1V8_CANGL
MAEESKVRGASEEMILTLSQLTSETENARREAEDMKIKIAELKKEAEVTMLALEEAEKKLKVALEEVEAAKAAEASALEQITMLTERTTTARTSTSESGAVITISKEEFDSLSRKVEESDKLADMKVAAAKAQVQAVKASENEALKRLETTQKEIEDIKTATQEALKKAEMAEATKRVVESELRRWREREQKKAVEAASRILAETQMSTETSPQHYRIQKQNPPHTTVEGKKLEKEKVSVSKKALLPNISVEPQYPYKLYLSGSGRAFDFGLDASFKNLAQSKGPTSYFDIPSPGLCSAKVANCQKSSYAFYSVYFKVGKVLPGKVNLEM